MLVDVNIGVRLHGSVAAPAALLSRDGNKAGKEVLTSHSDAFALLPASSLKSTEILILIFISRGLILWSIQWSYQPPEGRRRPHLAPHPTPTRS
jgi:hypothetical protein